MRLLTVAFLILLTPSLWAGPKEEAARIQLCNWLGISPKSTEYEIERAVAGQHYQNLIRGTVYDNSPRKPKRQDAADLQAQGNLRVDNLTELFAQAFGRESRGSGSFNKAIDDFLTLKKTLGLDSLEEIEVEIARRIASPDTEIPQGYINIFDNAYDRKPRTLAQLTDAGIIDAEGNFIGKTRTRVPTAAVPIQSLPADCNGAWKKLIGEHELN